MADIQLRTTVTRSLRASLSQNFGLPGTSDGRIRGGEADPIRLFEGMRRQSTRKIFDPKNLKGTIYSLKNRGIITHWIRDVCDALDLKPSTFCLAIQVCDTMILDNLKVLALNQCQLVAVTSLWIAAKFEEFDAVVPRLKTLSEVCEKTYTEAQIVDMEEGILQHFKWKLPHTTIMNYFFFYMFMLSFPSVMPEASIDPPLALCSKADSVVLKVIRGPFDKPRAFAEIPHVTVSLWRQQRLDKQLTAGWFAKNAAMDGPIGVSLSIYQIYGEDVVVAKKIDPTRTPQELRLEGGEVLFACASNSPAVFAEGTSIHVLRPLNLLFLQLSQHLIQLAVLSPEFLSTPPFIIAAAVLATARCFLSNRTKDVHRYVSNVFSLLNISRTALAEACDLLVAKYDATDAGAPITAVPGDIKDRLTIALCVKQP